MSDGRWEHIESLFHQALEKAPEEREQFLSEACGGDEQLRRQLAGMLDAHEPEARLRVEDRLLSGDDAHADEADAMVGKTVGTYRIVQLLGRGGMGTVYLAERGDDQYEHRVALKLIRPGLHTREVTERFLQERQILAQLEHPNIAILLDGGVTEDGRPYLVMQYVDGQPITDYCEEHQLGVRERLALFRTVCEAVHVAHSNLVVHRDLKPANILVTRDGQVKLLDFGIAKLLDPTMPSTTRPLDRVMTPEHAAPEQVAGEAVTTATDVYALGVLLYQLLTGRRPIEFPSSSTSDIERRVREVEPEPPSASAREHARALRGELDNIVLMALRKEPQRRYPSALEFGNDVGRFLDGQTVRAQRDTIGYRTRKFLARNRVGVAVAAMISVLVVGFAVTSAVQSRRIAAERDRAEIEQAKSERIVTVLTDLLAQANPFATPGGDTLRVSDFIDQIEGAVAELDDQPAVQARMWELLAGIHRARSNFDKTEEFYENALALYDADPGKELDAARIRHDMAVVTMQTRGKAAAEPLLRESLRRHRELLGDTHPDVGTAMQELASAVLESNPEEAMELLQAAMEIAHLNSRQGSVMSAALANRLGIYYLNESEYERAIENFESSLEILRQHFPEDHPNVLAVTTNLASTLGSRGEWEEAEIVFRQLLVTRERVLGPGSVETGRSWEGVGTSLSHQGRLEEALTAYENSLRIYVEAAGPYNDKTANATSNVASVLSLLGRSQEALVYVDSSIAIDRRVDGDNRSIVRKQASRAFLIFTMGDRERGIADGRRAVAEADRLARDETDRIHSDVRRSLAVMLMATGEAKEAEVMMRPVVDLHNGKAPKSNQYRAGANCMLAVALSQQGRIDEARELLQEYYATVESWGLFTPLHRELLDDALRITGLATN